MSRFLGSGTTLAAAEVTQRVCYGLELDPKYADVVVERWQGLTGKQATLEGDGTTFQEVKIQRQRSSGVASEEAGPSWAGSLPPRKQEGKKLRDRKAGRTAILGPSGSGRKSS